MLEPGEAEGVRSRLSPVVGRMAATAEEVAGVLGESEGVLSVDRKSDSTS